MSHQPFEDWIVGEEALTLDERQALEAHLKDCPACTGLATSLAAVERTLREATAVAPEPGFGLRFAHRVEQRHLRDMRRQGWTAFAVAAAAAALLAAPTAWRLTTTGASPGEVAVQMLIRAHDLVVGLRVAGGLTRAVLSNLEEIIPSTWALGLLAAGLGAVVIWMMTLYRFAFRRVKEGE